MFPHIIFRSLLRPLHLHHPHGELYLLHPPTMSSETTTPATAGIGLDADRETRTTRMSLKHWASSFVARHRRRHVASPGGAQRPPRAPKWWKIRLFRGMVNDLRRRGPYYWSDWKDAWDYRVVPATVYMYFAKYGAPVIEDLDLCFLSIVFILSFCPFLGQFVYDGPFASSRLCHPGSSRPSA